MYQSRHVPGTEIDHPFVPNFACTENTQTHRFFSCEKKVNNKTPKYSQNVLQKIS